MRTSDYGESWVEITNGIPADDYTRVIREDHERPGLLYAGTERGIYVSIDDGGRWQPIQANLPMTPIYDIKIKGNDLIAGTHGRSIWILDDLNVVRQLVESGNSDKAAPVRAATDTTNSRVNPARLTPSPARTTINTA